LGQNSRRKRATAACSQTRSDGARTGAERGWLNPFVSRLARAG
jgi:hypothetical protein